MFGLCDNAASELGIFRQDGQPPEQQQTQQCQARLENANMRGFAEFPRQTQSIAKDFPVGVYEGTAGEVAMEEKALEFNRAEGSWRGNSKSCGNLAPAGVGHSASLNSFDFGVHQNRWMTEHRTRNGERDESL